MRVWEPGDLPDKQQGRKGGGKELTAVVDRAVGQAMLQPNQWGKCILPTTQTNRLSQVAVRINNNKTIHDGVEAAVRDGELWIRYSK